ncbi:adenosylmethionine--8-amino-7-oxononanoate transaminase [Candidatus Methylacidithermus pantelleriae]|uniref:Adenosylmethionine-8-amino-7-oxononanoate aminotransferase n=1 Tax=Candidatus Methylacidithermus pantelleriae TaxID=2744239 RepID=A0A8J2BT74_9BACT|nr:adenosylmethionine--8-amino-7-oxononanoate transaminase [Candidatus Methylacidithermus pantelleriae]CAF0697195.1 Adenosylmethionine-8-amino-7-oxononanoate aminotransferase [Candidatus Methylacidithermus pantelleriae]
MSWVRKDRTFVWHPFTLYEEWFDPEDPFPVIVGSEGSYLYDEEGRAYLDGNSSIWTNLYGHRNPALIEAVCAQWRTLDHVSFLGLTHPSAILLAERLSQLFAQDSPVEFRAFFSDDGSTAVEAAIKIVWQYHRIREGRERDYFICLKGGYHGDTVGAMSVGNSPVFHAPFGKLLFSSRPVTSPSCYRCPYNRARPEKRDARLYRKCQWECVRDLERTLSKDPSRCTGVIVEPKVQAAAGMRMHPAGYLRAAAALCASLEVPLILDEVFTGFGRTGRMFAAHHEGVIADVVALGKGLTGGLLPLGATLVRQEIFASFRGGPSRAFLHGHSFTAYPAGCASALASLSLLEDVYWKKRIAEVSAAVARLSRRFWEHPNVGDVRQEGTVLAVELVEDFATAKPWPSELRLGAKICQRARRYGLLTRGIGNVLILVPPYCATDKEIEQMVDALFLALCDFLPLRKV